MKTADGSFAQCFNAQAVVDAAHQVIVATDSNNSAADSQTLVMMTEQITAKLAAHPNSCSPMPASAQRPTSRPPRRSLSRRARSS